MKILNIEQIRQADNYTIENEPIVSIDLMERASKGCCKWLKKRLNKDQHIKIFCGMGNNGGDGLVIARLLHIKGYRIEVFIIKHSNKGSEDFNINKQRLDDLEGACVQVIENEKDIPQINDDDIVIDAIFGSGLSKPITGFIGDIILNINKSGAVCISIDSPSGLFADKNNFLNDGAIICADYTLTFQFPKYSFLLAENDKYVGDWHVIPIGLHPEFIRNAETDNYFTSLQDIAPLIKKRSKFDHKGNYGHALIVSGSYGKIGAAILASEACLRSGVGLLTVHIPKCGYHALQTAVPEAMIDIDDGEEYLTSINNIENSSAIAIGPGIGQNEGTQNAFKLLIQNTYVPLVIDADAINILGENRTWLSFLPENSILTPHPKEFERITEKVNNSFDRITLQREFAIKHKVFVVLKGAYTSIACPDGKIFFNSTGNPGMATAGSGDVLTGIIVSLLAQGYGSKLAAILGVCLHGLAGDLSLHTNSLETLIAGDIVSNLGNAFKTIYETK